MNQVGLLLPTGEIEVVATAMVGKGKTVQVHLRHPGFHPVHLFPGDVEERLNRVPFQLHVISVQLALGELLLAAWYYTVPRYSTVDLAKTQRKKK